MKRYVKTTQMGVSCIQTLEQAIVEIREMYKESLLTDVIEVQFVEMEEEQYEKLPEFQGY